MNWREHIVSDQEILLGKPTIKGTRISVELILELLESGWSEDMIIQSYPGITREKMSAVFQFLKDSIQRDFYFPLQKSA